jgi:NAD(P)-dependent dehydrogenase (short-subunit alcohol dehydrogenase family)
MRENMTGNRITTSFGAQSTAAEVVAGTDLRGTRAIVTGAGSGIGVETARALAQAGAEVTLAVRNLDAGERVAADITATTGNARVLVAPLDLADQASVAAFVARWDGPLHILVNNAGIMASPELRTPQGWEMQFATNHLGHFALTTGLRDALTAAGGARVVVVSPVGHMTGSPAAFEPNSTDVSWKTTEQGAATSVLLAASPLVDGVSGRYFEDCNEAGPNQPGVRRGVAAYALDPEKAARLWQVSLDMLAGQAAPTGGR